MKDTDSNCLLTESESIKEFRDENIDYLFAKDGPIKKVKEDYAPRESQIEAAKIISNALINKEHVILEGPCGFGKSFAYMVPLLSGLSGELIKGSTIIVTAGISLQEQLQYKDIPSVKNILKLDDPSFDPKYAILKGRQNFICTRKVSDFIADEFTKSSIFRTKEDREQIDIILEWFKKTKTGDLSELSFVPNNEIFKQTVCQLSEDCMGKLCRYRPTCYYYKHKSLCEEADIVVTNYHMFFSDFKSGGNILPSYDNIIFDEAHETANIFRDFMEKKYSANTITFIKSKISQIQNLVPFLFSEELRDKLNELYKSNFTRQFMDINASKFLTRFENIVLIDENKKLVDFEEEVKWLEELHSLIFHISRSISGVIDEGCGDELRGECYKALNIVDSVSEVISDAMFILVEHLNSSDNDIFYIERIDEKVYIKHKPLDVSKVIANNYLNKVDGSCIFTSATMTVNSSSDPFEYIKNMLGFQYIEDKKVTTYIGESPFNLTNQQLWYLPKNIKDGNTKEFDQQLPVEILNIIRATHGGALLLFTSVKNMKNCYTNLSYESLGTLNGVNMLKQGDKPRIQLINDFKEDSDSVLFATKSFFTGVDVSGQSLRCLIIDKLPFPLLNDAVQQKLRESPNSFFKHCIPEMIISLKQAIGRGVRSVDDKCVIVILDGRLATARYKGKIASSFNYKKTSTRNIDDVSSFLGYEGLMKEELPSYDPNEVPF